MIKEDIDISTIRWADWSSDPYPLYRALRDRAPVYHDEPNNDYVITRYSDCAAILIDSKRYSNASTPIPEGQLQNPLSPIRSSDPPRHTYLRKMINPLFSPKKMRELEPYFVDVSREILDKAEQTEVMEASSQLGIPLPGRVTCDLMGIPLEQHQLLLELTEERLSLLLVSLGNTKPRPGMRTWDEVRADLWAVLGPVAEQRRREPTTDGMTLLVQAQAEAGRDQFSDDLLVDLLLHLLSGGFHTTQHLIEMLISMLADRPELWRRMREDRSLIPVAIEEMLRYDAPVQALPRRTHEEVEIAGVTIPKGASIKTVYGSANRDERVFPDPDEFSLDRRPNRHLAFSTGIHVCPGSPVSRAEARALFAEMADRYVAIERVGPSERWPSEQPQRTVESMHGFRSVPVRLVRA